MREEETAFYLNTEHQKIVLDRTNSDVPVAEEYGTVRRAVCADKHLSLRIFVDMSSIFVNSGEFVFTSRIFPKEVRGSNVFAEGTEASFDLKSGIKVFNCH